MNELTDQDKMRLVLARLRSHLAEAKYVLKGSADDGFCDHCGHWLKDDWHDPDCPVQEAYEREGLASRDGDIELTLDVLNKWYPPERGA